MKITDEVVFEKGKTDIVLFRWHLGTEEKAIISGEEKCYTVIFPKTVLDIESDGPLVVTQTFMPDHTLNGHSAEDEPGNRHTCLIPQSTAPVERMTLTSRFRPV